MGSLDAAIAQHLTAGGTSSQGAEAAPKVPDQVSCREYPLLNMELGVFISPYLL